MYLSLVRISPWSFLLNLLCSALFGWLQSPPIYPLFHYFSADKLCNPQPQSWMNVLSWVWRLFRNIFLSLLDLPPSQGLLSCVRGVSEPNHFLISSIFNKRGRRAQRNWDQYLQRKKESDEEKLSSQDLSRSNPGQVWARSEPYPLMIGWY